MYAYGPGGLLARDYPLVAGHESGLPLRRFAPAERRRWVRQIYRIYRRMGAHAEPYEIKCNGLSLTVLPGVYAPLFFSDSEWFTAQLPSIVGQKSLLEIGTGTGIVSVACAMNGARVVATDINPLAVENARINSIAHKLRMPILYGDVYQAIEHHQRFDFIFWAHPFNNWPRPVRNMLLRSGMDYKYSGLKSFILGAKQHLTRTGKLLLGTGDSADLKAIWSFATTNGYEPPRIIRQVTLPLQEDQARSGQITYFIYEFSPVTLS